VSLTDNGGPVDPIAETQRFFDGDESYVTVTICCRAAPNPRGSYQAGGSSLLGPEGAAWEEVAEDPYLASVTDPPILIVSYQIDEEDEIDLQMRYTSTEPYATQSTPSNSLGGHPSSNRIYQRTRLADHINTTETSIPYSGTYPLTTTSGIAQVGPEVLSYTSVDTSDLELDSATRGVSPGKAFPATTDFQSERIHYLEADKLFDNTPTGSTQMRCVAVMNASTGYSHGTDKSPVSTRIHLVQNSSDNVSIDVGIEVPNHDVHYGIVSEGVSGTTLVDASSFSSLATGYFNGSSVEVSGTTALIVSFAVDVDGRATFVLDQSVSAVAGAQFRVNPAPSQTISNETSEPGSASGRFLGFLGEGGSNTINYGGIREHGSSFDPHDVFYLWVKRTLTENVLSSTETGAVVILEFIDPRL